MHMPRHTDQLESLPTVTDEASDALESAAGADADTAVLHALLLDGHGGARALSPDDIPCGELSGGVLWLHVDATHEDAPALLTRVPGLDARQAALLASEDTRPHAEVAGDAVRLVLRGVNLHPDANPEDMVSLRLWAAKGRVASARRRRLLSVEDVLEALAEGYGPRTAGELLAALSGRLISRLQDTADALDERVQILEDTTADDALGPVRREVSDIRRIAIILRRYLAPQRDALAHLCNARLSWLGEEERTDLRDSLDVLTRHVENLDALRERASVVREELAGQLAELTNRRMFLLSLLSAIFLPLSFLTGLLGTNVGGIPGAQSANGFAVASAVLAAIGLLIVLVFRFGRWL